MGLVHQALIVGADHPSLHEALAHFNEAIGELHSLGLQHRHPTHVRAPHATGGRLAAVYHGQVIAAAQLSISGKLHIAVLPEFHGMGIAEELASVWTSRAKQAGYGMVPHSA
jgi:GNAT superfamily N-acetyltransferase